ncbi:MAG TPA: hypothetical protein DCF63_18770 [Planctomycetaceae bacterium]|nr:hypothetical protein [Planctomycetaceae bacterium]
MGMLIRMFAAFCVATVIAQLLILGIVAAKGNLRSDTVTQAIALVNGIDATGSQLEEALRRAENRPSPTHEEIVQERAKQSLDLQNQLAAITREKDMVSKLLADLTSRNAEFDRRRQDFFVKVDELEKKTMQESLQRVQQTIEELPPDQGKDQLIKMLAADRMEDVVAIVKVMDPGKRKKILGEFAAEKDSDKLHDMLMTMLSGQPVASLIESQRKSLNETP